MSATDKKTIEFNLMPWIRDKLFAKGKKNANIHTFFRKSLEIDKNQIANATLIFTADDYCKIYINGMFTIAGPAPGYIHCYNYMSLDIRDGLVSGRNCIAIHSYYQGLKNHVWISGDGFAGVKVLLKVRYENGNEQNIQTDSSWHCYDCKAYKGGHILGYDTQYAENIDLNLMPEGWQTVDFDDSSWNKPETINEYPHKLTEQTTSALMWNNIYPANILCITDGRYLVDFGREVVGCTVLYASGSSGHIIEIRHAEELNQDGSARQELRANCNYQEFITLSGSAKNKIEFFDYKAFRYVELLNYPEYLKCDDIFVIERHYPFEDVSELQTSDDTLNKIWSICALATKLGTQDSFLDCMTREKGAYLGDAFVTGMSHLYLTGRSKMLKKVLQDFAESAKSCPGLRAVGPSGFEQDIADYSLLWIPLLYEYYMWTGDLNFLRKNLPVADEILEYFQAYENRDGLLENFTGKPIMVDWPSNMRDEYDDLGLMSGNTSQKGINALINLYYYGTIIAIAKIHEALEHSEQADMCNKKADFLIQNFKKRFLRAEGFIDTDSSTHVSLHTNALALMFDAVEQEEAETIISLLKKKRMECGVYFSFFLLKGLFNYGEAEFAYELITCDDLHSWQTMLKEGASTCMEAWGLDQKWNTSMCHPWASAPIYMVAAKLFGLKPATPGWKNISFAPQIPDSMKHGSISINIPQGKVKVSFAKEGGQIKYNLRIPEKCKLITTTENVQEKGKFKTGKELKT